MRPQRSKVVGVSGFCCLRQQRAQPQTPGPDYESRSSGDPGAEPSGPGLAGLPGDGVGVQRVPVSGVSVLREEGVPERRVLRRRAGPSSTRPTRSANLSEHTVSPRSSGRVEICGGAARWAGPGMQIDPEWCWWAGPGMQIAPWASPQPAQEAHLQQQHRGGAGAERGLKQACELRVTEGHVRPSGPQRRHHPSQRQQRAIDGPGLPEALGVVSVAPGPADGPLLPGALGPRQVHQVQRACGASEPSGGDSQQGPPCARSCSASAERPSTAGRGSAVVPVVPEPRGGDAACRVSVTSA